MAEKAGKGSSTSSPTRTFIEESGTPSFANFSAFREITQEERETARAERETGAAEQLRLQLVLRETRQSRSVAQSSTAAGRGSTTKFCGTTVEPFRIQEPARGFTSGDERVRSHMNSPVLHSPRAQGEAGETAMTELCRFKGRVRPTSDK